MPGVSFGSGAPCEDGTQRPGGCMEIGIDSFAIAFPAGKTGTPAAASEHLHHLIEQIELADQVGLDIYGVGEHHRQEFLDSAPTIIMGVAAARHPPIPPASAPPLPKAA